MAARKLKKINVKRPEKVRVSDMKFATPFLLGKKLSLAPLLTSKIVFTKFFEFVKFIEIHVSTYKVNNWP